jgi:hypothetical protein
MHFVSERNVYEPRSNSELMQPYLTRLNILSKRGPYERVHVTCYPFYQHCIDSLEGDKKTQFHS